MGRGKFFSEIESRYDDGYIEVKQASTQSKIFYMALIFAALVAIGVLAAILTLYLRSDRMFCFYHCNDYHYFDDILFILSLGSTTINQSYKYYDSP